MSVLNGQIKLKINIERTDQIAMSSAEYIVPTMAEMAAKGESPEVLFWVGCAGSFDERYKSVTRAFVKILNNNFF